MNKKFSWDNIVVVGKKKTSISVKRKPFGAAWDRATSGPFMNTETAGPLFIERHEVDRGILYEANRK